MLGFNRGDRDGRTLTADVRTLTAKHQIKTAPFVEFHFLLRWPVRNEDLSKLQRVLLGSPPAPCPIKVSPLRPLLQTSTNHQVREIIPSRDRETEYYVFPSLYHKYINYANYEHCILTKSHFLSPFRWYARRANAGGCVQLTARNAACFSAIPGSCEAPCHCLCQSRIIKNSSQLPDWR